jgi:hypothetical protein
LEYSHKHGSRHVNTEVFKPADNILQAFNDPRVVVMIEPRLGPSIDITSNSDDSDLDEISEPASLSASEDFLPQVLGQETFELEFFTHWRYLSSRAASPKAISKPFDPSKRSTTTTGCEIVGRTTPPVVRRWFRRPYDPYFLVHLLDLYFYWIHPS